MRLMVLLFGAAAVASASLFASAAEVGPNDVAIVDMTVAAPLTEQPGDPAAGAKVFAGTRAGNCLACHVNDKMPTELFQGNVGPELNGVADRYSVEELRAIVVNAKAVFGEESTMPGFYSLDVGINVREESVGKTVLTAQEVEDVVAYLSTMKE